MPSPRASGLLRWPVVVVAIALLAGAVVGLAGGTAADPPGDASVDRAGKVLPQSFVSRPDLRPAALTVDIAAHDTAPGSVLIAPKGGRSQWGPMIVDNGGRLVWFKPMAQGVIADDFSVQTYEGKPVLTWWEGKNRGLGYGSGEWVIADTSYREIARVKSGRGLFGADLHEMQLTDRGTAYVVVYQPVKADLRPVGGRADGNLLDSVIQEVDVATGKVLWQWDASEHVAVAESHMSGPPKTAGARPYDYFHVNAVDEQADGSLLVSARNTWTIYKLDKRTGKIVWRLGGKRSDFKLGEGARFAWQHDIRRQPDGTLTLFDNEATPPVGPESRLLSLRADERAMTVSVTHAFTHPGKVLAFAEGNYQVLPGGGAFTSWGISRRVSEFGPDGKLRLDWRLPGDSDSYRAYRVSWTGTPTDAPTLAVRGGRAFASWNGATEVTGWQLLAGDDEASLEPVGTARRVGFETAIQIPTGVRLVAVRALAGAKGLGRSPTVAVRR